MAGYYELLQAVEGYYGSGSDQWIKMANHSASSVEMAQILKKVPGVHTTVNSRGQLIGWDLFNAFPSEFNPPAEINSNVPDAVFSNTSFQGAINATYEVIDDTTTPPKMGTVSGARAVGTGTKVLTTVGNVSSAFFFAGLGGRLGKKINSAFGGQYAWDDADWEEWVSGKDPLDQAVFRTLFGIDGNNMTAYAPEETLAALYKMYEQMGVYDVGEDTAEYDGSVDVTGITQPITLYPPTVVTTVQKGKYYNEFYFTNAEYIVFVDTPNGLRAVAYSRTTNPTIYFKSSKTGSYYVWTGTDTYVTPNGVRFYTNEYVNLSSSFGTTWTPYGRTGTPVVQPALGHGFANKIAVIIYDGTITHTGGVDGIEDDPRATTQVDPNVITGTTPATILPQLKQNYPQLFDGAIYEDVLQDDGTSKRITYIPFPFPTTDADGKPITGTPSQTNPAIDPITAGKPILDNISDILTIPAKPNVPDTGTGDSPVVTTPSGSASSLWKIYNPTQAQVDAFGAWLWDSSFVEQIKKLFNDPMQGIIGIHKVFATPSTGGTATIKVGYLDSQVSSAWVDNQYTTVDCGTVKLREYFGNVFDYSPFTKVSLYLPFIGIVDLDVADVMRSSIKVKYHVDVLSGACLADVIVTRDMCSAVLYQYAGSAIVTYPVSSGTYLGVVAGVGAIATGAIASILTGGMASSALAVAGTATGLSHLHANVGHSGNFGGCAGAMAGKKPYLIISRPQTALADNFKHFTGFPANSNVVLKDCSGYTKVKSVYTHHITKATNTEKDMIEAQLKAGVLIE